MKDYKLSLMGSGGVGKSSMVKMFTTETFDEVLVFSFATICLNKRNK